MWTQTQVKHRQGRLSQMKEAKSSSVPGMLTDGQEHSLAAFQSISESDWCLGSHILLFGNADRKREIMREYRERRQFNITCTMHGSREVWAKKEEDLPITWCSTSCSSIIELFPFTVLSGSQRGLSDCVRRHGLTDLSLIQ